MRASGGGYHCEATLEVAWTEGCLWYRAGEKGFALSFTTVFLAPRKMPAQLSSSVSDWGLESVFL